MTVMKRLVIAVSAVGLGMLLSVPSFAARAIASTVGEVSAADAAALGQSGFRIYSAHPGGESNINDNTFSCRNMRCLRTYSTNPTLQPGGYVGNMEATAVYNGDLTDQPYYSLVDADMNDLAANHIGFWAVAGVTGNNSGVGSQLAAGCSGLTAQNCMFRLDSAFAEPPLTGTYVSYGGPPGTIRAIGGLNPIPNVLIDSVTANNAHLSWRDPQLYASAMHASNTGPAPPSPVKGVRLWKNERLGSCTDPTGSDPGWTSVGTFDLGNTTTSVTLNPAAACTFFALTVRVIGPGGNDVELETGQQATTHFVGVNSFPVRSCDDLNTCTNDTFDVGMSQCVYTNNTNPCDDGNPCTVNEACGGGACGGGQANTCDDANVCTTDTCSPGSGCAHASNTLPCEDANACTVNTVCSNGTCGGGQPLDCNDINICTSDTCNPASGCGHTNNTLTCNDGNACTVNDRCGGGACSGTLSPDTDGDGVRDSCDNCPSVANASQTNSDGEGGGDACDNCPFVSNPNQANADGDPFGDACDNCPTVVNGAQVDSDHDGRGNACDNCLSVANVDQADADADAVGNACDNCPSDYNPTQVDQDVDGFGDACDNCPGIDNTDQADNDNDAEGDACDTDDGALLFTQVTRIRLDWQHETVYQRFNLYRGSLERLIATGEYTQDSGTEPEAARFCNLPTFTQLDAHNPPVARVNFYLVTGEGPGPESSLGTRSDGSTRPSSHPCP